MSGFPNKENTGTPLTASELLLVQTAAAGVLLLVETTAPSATTGVGKVYVKSSDSRLYFKDDSGVEYDLAATGTGDVVGPASSVNNAIVRFDGVTGKLVKGYTSGSPTVSDTGAVTVQDTVFLSTQGLLTFSSDLGNGEGGTILGAVAAKGVLVRGGATGTGVFVNSSNNVGIGTTVPDRLLHEEVSDAGTNAVVFGQRHSHITSGIAAVGFGIGEEYELENASGTNVVAATQEVAWTDATNLSEDATWKLRLVRGGTLTDAVTIDSLGASIFAGPLSVGTANAITAGSIELGAAADTTLTRSAAGQLAVEGVDVLTTSNTKTVTNKRNQPRTASSTSAATLDPDLASANVYYRTTQTVGLTISAPIGTPIIGELLTIYVDSVASQTLTINAAFVAFGSAFPAATTAGKTFMLTAQFNGTDWKSTWSNAV